MPSGRCLCQNNHDTCLCSALETGGGVFCDKPTNDDARIHSDRCFCEQPYEDVRWLSPDANQKRHLRCECDIKRYLVTKHRRQFQLHGWHAESTDTATRLTKRCSRMPLSPHPTSNLGLTRIRSVRPVDLRDPDSGRESPFRHHADIGDYMKEYRKKYVHKMVGFDGQTGKNLVLGENIFDPYVFKTVTYRRLYDQISEILTVSRCQGIDFSTANVLNNDDPDAEDAQRASTAKLRQMSSHQKVRKLIRDREMSAEDRRLPALAVKSCSTKSGWKYDQDKQAHCEFEQRHTLEERTRAGSLPNIHWSSPHQNGGRVNNNSNNNSNNSLNMAIQGSGKHIPLSGVPHIELTARLRSLDGIEPEVRDNINVIMLKFIKQARESIEISKENRKKLESASTKSVDMPTTMKLKEKNLRIATIPHRRLGEVKGRLIKSR